MSLLIFALNCESQIIIDENYGDWENVEDYYKDSANDGKNGFDFGEMKVYNDSKYIYINFTTGQEINLQQDNDVKLMIDVDNNPNTGFKKQGLGVDIVYNFGSRYGRYYRNSKKHDFYHQDIELISLPTVTSNKFELAFLRKFEVGDYLISLNSKIKILLTQDFYDGDIMPDETGGYSYEMKDYEYKVPEYSLEKEDKEDLRIMSFNVEKDNYFKNEPPYKRMIKAIEPDILCFQEIYDNSSTSVKNKIKSYFGGNWYHSKKGTDLIVVSKYPIKNAFLIGGNSAFLIDKEGKEILIVNCHLYCCDKDAKRQKEVDRIMKYIREAKNGESTYNLKENTPIIILGDMNFVGDNNQRKTLIEGDIYNESSFGEDFKPDWDNSFFEDAVPNTLGYPATFTWNADDSNHGGYPKGRLDYVIYSGSVLEKKNSYALCTRELDSGTLNEYKLNAEDTNNASDHFPVVVDFEIKNKISTEEIFAENSTFNIEEYFPIPTKDILNINLINKSEHTFFIDIYDVTGHKVMSKNILSKQGKNLIQIETSNLDSGIYFVKIQTLNNFKTIKLIVE